MVRIKSNSSAPASAGCTISLGLNPGLHQCCNHILLLSRGGDDRSMFLSTQFPEPLNSEATELLNSSHVGLLLSACGSIADPTAATKSHKLRDFDILMQHRLIES